MSDAFKFFKKLKNLNASDDKVLKIKEVNLRFKTR